MYSSDTIESGALSSAAEGEAAVDAPGRVDASVNGFPFPLLRRRVSARFATLFCCVLGLAVLSPSIWSGLVADDYLHTLMLRDDPGVRGLSHRPLDLFRFADGNPDTAHALVNEGVFPWWVDPRVLLAFFRPLSSFTHYIDH
ncbi:MAG TPA: hypothetical protein VMG12_16640, partial [Polyangiaceae bacterium]|nr:hypothetical protein [Polyangiaceae bacterium]